MSLRRCGARALDVRLPSPRVRLPSSSCGSPMPVVGIWCSPRRPYPGVGRVQQSRDTLPLQRVRVVVIVGVQTQRWLGAALASSSSSSIPSPLLGSALARPLSIPSRRFCSRAVVVVGTQQRAVLDARLHTSSWVLDVGVGLVLPLCGVGLPSTSVLLIGDRHLRCGAALCIGDGLPSTFVGPHRHVCPALPWHCPPPTPWTAAIPGHGCGGSAMLALAPGPPTSRVPLVFLLPYPSVARGQAGPHPSVEGRGVCE